MLENSLEKAVDRWHRLKIRSARQVFKTRIFLCESQECAISFGQISPNVLIDVQAKGLTLSLSLSAQADKGREISDFPITSPLSHTCSSPGNLFSFPGVSSAEDKDLDKQSVVWNLRVWISLGYWGFQRDNGLACIWTTPEWATPSFSPFPSCVLINLTFPPQPDCSSQNATASTHPNHIWNWSSTTAFNLS